jgi:bifunctional lysine-specific demethylase and histidyl-hydroxylase MINA
MRLPDALAVLDAVLAPETSGDFLNGLTSGQWRRLPTAASAARLHLLGVDPRATLSGATAIATELTYHSANAAAPAPALRPVADAAAFKAHIADFHDRHYSVRFPGLRPTSAALDHFCRGLECVLHKSVTASAFWSQGGMQAPVHSDDHDLLVIQVVGRKRWFIAAGPSPLDNTWERIPAGPPSLGPTPATFEVGPGDAVYLPRGTVHAVEGDEESIHVSIGFTPLTVREALIAAIDHLSDLDRGWRTTATPFLAQQLLTGRMDPLPEFLSQAARSLTEALHAPGFVAAALQRRSARAVGLLTATAPAAVVNLTLDSVLRQRPDSFCHLSANPDKIDVAYPDGHLYIHRGAEAAVLFLVNNSQFRVRDIPGEVDDAVRLSLASRFCEVGLLEPLPAE